MTYYRLVKTDRCNVEKKDVFPLSSLGIHKSCGIRLLALP
uniref:Uncharacterized protein n=1 Tax=Arundo donax TaxID=35708 RepID=A0A0A8ZGN2_ARUDO